MSKRLFAFGFVGTAVISLLVTVALANRGLGVSSDEPSPRQFRFTYDVVVSPPADSAKSFDVFLPLAQSNDHQTILERRVESPVPGREHLEEEYGNLFWHTRVEKLKEPLNISVHYLVERFPQQEDQSGGVLETDEERAELPLFLKANRLTPVSGPLIDQIRAEIQVGDLPPMERARAIYDYVIDNMEYKKVGDGWGNGSTEWACSQKYGNCTDFHALFISLARAEDIPARFHIGFPLSDNEPRGEIDGYHCWVEFYIEDRGWIPVDASEAWKAPEKRDFFFGSQEANRLMFTVGRDLRLGEFHDGGPLNYFVYPHVEVEQERYQDVRVSFRFEDTDAGDRSG